MTRTEDPDLLASLFPVYVKAYHPIALFPVYPKVNHPSLLINRIENNLPDDRPRKSKFEFKNPANKVEFLACAGQFQLQDGDFDLENQHRIDNKVNRVRIIIIKFVIGGHPCFVMKFRTRHILKNKRRAIKISS
jgi:hypothetical protein